MKENGVNGISKGGYSMGLFSYTKNLLLKIEEGKYEKRRIACIALQGKLGKDRCIGYDDWYLCKGCPYRSAKNS